MNRLVFLALVTLMSAGTAACGSVTPSPTPGPGQTALPAPTPVRVPDATPIAVSLSATSPAPPQQTAPLPEPTDFAAPTPVCPAPPNEVRPPTVIASVGASAVVATNGNSGFLTCSTAGTSDAAPTDPKVGVVARPGDQMTLTLSTGWQILRWEGYDSAAEGEGSNIWLPIDTPHRPNRIAVPVPGRSGSSIAGYHLWLVSVDGRAVGGLDILVRVTVR